MHTVGIPAAQGRPWTRTSDREDGACHQRRHLMIDHANETGMTTLPDTSHDFFATFLEGARQHAPYFSLSSDPQVNEAEVALVLSEQLSKQGTKTFHSIVPRRQPNDPPDCEAIGPNGERIGIEVTALVDGHSIAAAKRGDFVSQEIWKPSRVIEEIASIVRKKDRAVPKGGPYKSYILIICCDDPLYLDNENLDAIRNTTFPATK